jgi:hypothetical protein
MSLNDRDRLTGKRKELQQKKDMIRESTEKSYGGDVRRKDTA